MALDDLVQRAAILRAMKAEYETHEIDVPAWIPTRLRDVTRSIEIKRLDMVEKRLANARARAAALTPEEEQRKAVQEEIAALEKQLDASK